MFRYIMTSPVKIQVNHPFTALMSISYPQEVTNFQNILINFSLSPPSPPPPPQDAVVNKKKPTIYSFVEAGKEYFPKLCKALMALVYFTPVLHEDQKHLSNIVDGMLPLYS